MRNGYFQGCTHNWGRLVCGISTKKLIADTEAASGMGLAVATALASKGWKVSLADLSVERGKLAAQNLNATFYATNVNDYYSLASTFDNTFKAHGRIDFGMIFHI